MSQFASMSAKNRSTPQPAAGTAARVPRDFAEAETLINRELRKVARRVKWADIIAELCALAALLTGLTLGAVVLDQWVFPGGLPSWGRVITFCLLVGVGAARLLVRVIPLLVGRVTPAFAAFMIEQGVPWLRNALLSFVFLRQEWVGKPQPQGGIKRSTDGGKHPSQERNSSLEGQTPEEELREKILVSLGYTAAAQLGHIPPEVKVDYTPAIRWGYVLVAVWGVAVFYWLLSPKSTLVSFMRISHPLANIPPATRVQFGEIRPGDAEAELGTRITVSAEVRGLRTGEQVLLFAKALDGREWNSPVRLEVSGRSLLYEATIPPEEGGIKESFIYWLEAGDARSAEFIVRALPPVTMAVRRVVIEPPHYTDLPPRTLEGVADFQALERSTVRFEVEASEPLSDCILVWQTVGGAGRSAHGRANLREKSTARWEGTLELPELGPNAQRPGVIQYAFSGMTRSGRRVKEDFWRQVEVLPDRPPSIELLGFSGERAILPVEAEIALTIRAVDPDFGLRRVELCVTGSRHQELRHTLFDAASQRTAISSNWERRILVSAKALGLSPGEEARVWAVAWDSREPQPNRAETAKFLLVAEVPGQRDLTSSPSATTEIPLAGAPGDVSARTGREGVTSQPGGEQPPGETSESAVGVQRPGEEPSSGTEILELRPLERGRPGGKPQAENVGQLARVDRPDEPSAAFEMQPDAPPGEEVIPSKDPADARPDPKLTGSREATTQAGRQEDTSTRTSSAVDTGRDGHFPPNNGGNNDQSAESTGTGSGGESARPVERDRQETVEANQWPSAGSNSDQTQSGQTSSKENNRPGRQSRGRTPNDTRRPGDDSQVGSGSAPDRLPPVNPADAGEIFERILDYLQSFQDVGPDSQATEVQPGSQVATSSEGKTTSDSAPESSPKSPSASSSPLPGESQEPDRSGIEPGGSRASTPESGSSDSAFPVRDGLPPSAQGESQEAKHPDQKGSAAANNPGSEAASAGGDTSRMPSSGEIDQESRQTLGPAQTASSAAGENSAGTGSPGPLLQSSGNDGDSPRIASRQAGDGTPHNPTTRPGEREPSGPAVAATASDLPATGAPSASSDQAGQAVRRSPPDQVAERRELPDHGRVETGAHPSRRTPAALPTQIMEGPPGGAEASRGAAEMPAPSSPSPGQGNPRVIPPSPGEISSPQLDPAETPPRRPESSAPEALSPSTSPGQSRTEGQLEGDRSGGGGPGGGQRAAQPGAGAEGSSSRQPGGGTLSPMPGGEELAPTVTPQFPAGMADRGGRQTPSPEGAGQSSGSEGEVSIAGSGVPQSAQSPGEPSAAQRERYAAAGNPVFGGTGPPGPGGSGVPSAAQPIYRPDEVNLAYAEKVTDLVLEYLRTNVEKGQVDPQLLERLGWSEEELIRFYQEWARLREEASRTDNPSAREDYRRALQALGLRPGAKALRPGNLQGRAPQIKQFSVPDPPPEWAEYFRAYRARMAREE